MTPGRTSAGFTMVELIVVIVLTGILAITVAPKMFGANMADEFGYQAELRSAIAYAQKTSIAARRFICVDVAASGATFTMLPTEPEAVGASVSCTQPLDLPKVRASCSGNPANRICPPSGVSSGTASWVFDPLGRPMNSSRVALTSALSLSVTNQPAITVEAETGYVH